MGGDEKKTGLHRVGAWCARLIARMSKHSSSSKANKKQRDADADGSPETENESWVTTTQRTHRFSTDNSSYYDDGASITTDRAPSSLNPMPRARTASSRSNSQRPTNRDANESIEQSATGLEPRESSDATRDELSLIASQRLHVSGLYARAQHLKRKKLRELSHEKSLQKPLSHIQVRRRLSHEKEMLTSGTVITPAFVSIRKAELGWDARRRLHTVGFNADDSVPPWLPATATADRWSCELAVGSPRSNSAMCDPRPPSKPRDLKLHTQCASESPEV